MLEQLTTMGMSLSQKTADGIVEHIKSSGLKPGDRIPNEAEFCEKLCVSRSTVREAIKSLVSRNILTIKKGVGTFVCENPGRADDPLGFDFVEDKVRLILDLMQFRQIIEPELVRLAAVNSTEDEISRLESIEEELEKAYEEGRDTTSMDIQFHSEIAKGSHNQVVELVFPILTESIPAVNEYTRKSLMDDSIVDHRAIIKAIRNHNPDIAKELMTKHLKRNTDTISNLKS